MKKPRAQETHPDPSKKCLWISPACMQALSREEIELRSWEDVRKGQYRDFHRFSLIVASPWCPHPGKQRRSFPQEIARAIRLSVSQGGVAVFLVPGSRCTVDPQQIDPADFPDEGKPNAPEAQQQAIQILQMKAVLLPSDVCGMTMAFRTLLFSSMKPVPAPGLSLLGEPNSLLAYLERHPPEVTAWSVAASPSVKVTDLIQWGREGESVAWFAPISDGRMFVLPINAPEITIQDLQLLQEIGQLGFPVPLRIEFPEAQPAKALLSIDEEDRRRDTDSLTPQYTALMRRFLLHEDGSARSGKESVSLNEVEKLLHVDGTQEARNRIYKLIGWFRAFLEKHHRPPHDVLVLSDNAAGHYKLKFPDQFRIQGVEAPGDPLDELFLDGMGANS